MKIIIDFDDTLLDRTRLSADVYAEFGEVAPAVLDAHYRDFRETAPFTLGGFASYLNDRGVNGDKLQDIYLSKLEQADEYAFPDAASFLSSLKSLGHELVLLTVDAEPEKWQQPKVQASGLAELFDQIEITSGTKTEALKKLGVTGPFVFIDDKSAELSSMIAEFPDAVCLPHEPGSPLADHLPDIAAVNHERELNSLPLPINTSIPLGQIAAPDGEMLRVTFGLDAEAVAAFKKRSCDQTDEELMRFTSDHERICLGSYEAWYAKERYPFGLTNSAGELAGIAWFGPKALPEDIGNAALSMPPRSPANADWHTFAIRMYQPYRGKRLAVPFASFVFQAYNRFLPHHPLWLDTNAANVGAIKLYSKLGFTECGRREDGRVVMMKE